MKTLDQQIKAIEQEIKYFNWLGTRTDESEQHFIKSKLANLYDRYFVVVGKPYTPPADHFDMRVRK